MSLFSKLFDKQNPHSRYMQLELELEDLASEAGFSLTQLKKETNSLKDLAFLISLLGEEQASIAQKKHLEMEKIFPSLTAEEKSYHQNPEDLFDDWRDKIT